MSRHPIYVGTAGWSIGRAHAERFGAGASQLARYATQFNAVEINSSFYRSHRPATYARWATTTTDPFRFAVKMPREITHTRRLRDSAEPIGRFVDEVRALGLKLGPVLVQLPPSLAFDPCIAADFWRELRDQWAGPVVCEPRHPSWFGEAANQLLETWQVARVAADPPPAQQADEPAGWSGLRYMRLHGTPRRYYDPYCDPALERIAQQMANLAADAPVWCIFDNTAAGAATPNALRVLELLQTYEQTSR